MAKSQLFSPPDARGNMWCKCSYFVVSIGQHSTIKILDEVGDLVVTIFFFVADEAHIGRSGMMIAGAAWYRPISTYASFMDLLSDAISPVHFRYNINNQQMKLTEKTPTKRRIGR